MSAPGSGPGLPLPPTVAPTAPPAGGGPALTLLTDAAIIVKLPDRLAGLQRALVLSGTVTAQRDGVATVRTAAGEMQIRTPLPLPTDRPVTLQVPPPAPGTPTLVTILAPPPPASPAPAVPLPTPAVPSAPTVPSPTIPAGPVLTPGVSVPAVIIAPPPVPPALALPDAPTTTPAALPVPAPLPGVPTSPPAAGPPPPPMPGMPLPPPTGGGPALPPSPTPAPPPALPLAAPPGPPAPAGTAAPAPIAVPAPPSAPASPPPVTGPALPQAPAPVTGNNGADAPAQGEIPRSDAARPPPVETGPRRPLSTTGLLTLTSFDDEPSVPIAPPPARFTARPAGPEAQTVPARGPAPAAPAAVAPLPAPSLASRPVTPPAAPPAPGPVGPVPGPNPPSLVGHVPAPPATPVAGGIAAPPPPAAGPVPPPAIPAGTTPGAQTQAAPANPSPPPPAAAPVAPQTGPSAPIPTGRPMAAPPSTPMPASPLPVAPAVAATPVTITAAAAPPTGVNIPLPPPTTPAAPTLATTAPMMVATAAPAAPAPLPQPAATPDALALPRGEPLRVRIIALEPPPAGTTPGPALQPATLVGNTSLGQPILTTAAGTLVLAGRSDLPPGTGLTVALEPPASAAMLPPLDALHGTDWPALREMMQLVAASDPGLARSLTQQMLPQPNKRLTTNMIFFLSALKGGDLSGWLAPEATSLLERQGRGALLARLREDFQAASQQAAEPLPDGWRSLPIPFATAEGVGRMQLHLRKIGDGEETEAEPAGEARAQRFLLDLSFSRIGPMQLDGLVRPGRLDLVIRTHTLLQADIRQGIGDLFRDSLDLAGYAGTIGFQTGAHRWAKVRAGRAGAGQQV